VTNTLGAAVAIASVVALSVAALVPELRLPLFVVLLGSVVVAPRDASWRWAVAGALPVSALFVLAHHLLDGQLDGPFECADPTSPVAWLRALEAFIVIAAILGLAHWLGSAARELGLRRPSRNEALLGVAAIVLIPVPSLYLGTVLAEPFFGRIELDLSQPAAIAPALILAVANGTMEELAYRGALMAWLSRAAGPRVGLVGQAVVFGAAHTGPDFTGPVLPVVLAIIAGGLIAGLIVRRTGSLWLPIVVHICFDIPLYYAAACRLT
jgi:membrane protease YdiL (CAAX protease family)